MMSVTTAVLLSGSSGYLDGYMDKTAKVEGYHYGRGGKLPGNFLDMPPEEQEQVLQWYKEHTPDKNTDRYKQDRVRLEKALREEAVKKLGDKVQLKHPLYFRTDKQKKAWGHDIKSTQVYPIDEELLQASTFSPGDSFDYLRRERHNKSNLSEEVKTLMTLVELRKAGKLDMLPRLTGNYVEGQVWAPYELKDGKIIAKTAGDKGEVPADASKEISKKAVPVVKPIVSGVDTPRRVISSTYPSPEAFKKSLEQAREYRKKEGYKNRFAMRLDDKALDRPFPYKILRNEDAPDKSGGGFIYSPGKRIPDIWIRPHTARLLPHEYRHVLQHARKWYPLKGEGKGTAQDVVRENAARNKRHLSADTWAHDKMSEMVQDTDEKGKFIEARSKRHTAPYTMRQIEREARLGNLKALASHMGVDVSDKKKAFAFLQWATSPDRKIKRELKPMVDDSFDLRALRSIMEREGKGKEWEALLWDMAEDFLGLVNKDPSTRMASKTAGDKAHEAIHPWLSKAEGFSPTAKHVTNAEGVKEPYPTIGTGHYMSPANTSKLSKIWGNNRFKQLRSGKGTIKTKEDWAATKHHLEKIVPTQLDAWNPNWRKLNPMMQNWLKIHAYALGDNLKEFQQGHNAVNALMVNPTAENAERLRQSFRNSQYARQTGTRLDKVKPLFESGKRISLQRATKGVL